MWQSWTGGAVLLIGLLIGAGANNTGSSEGMLLCLVMILIGSKVMRLW
jgi:hypothetical protein